MIRMKLKEAFLDSELVMGATDRATRKNMNYFGGYVRKVARNSIKKAPQIDIATGQRLGRGRRRAGVKTRDAVSEPGKPPFSHVGTLRQLIYYGYDVNTRSVVIGPEAALRNTIWALEQGGEISIGPTRHRPSRRVRLRPRPYMLPAFEVGKERLPEIWADSIKP